MTLLPPIDKVGKPFLGSVKIDLAFGCGRCGAIEIRDEAGGAFVLFHSHDKEGLALDPDELIRVSRWAKKLCDEVTKFNSTGG